MNDLQSREQQIQERLKKGEVAEALELTGALLSDLVDNEQISSAIIAKHLSNFGSLLELTGSGKEAYPFFEQALELEALTYGESSLQTFATSLNLGTVALRNGDHGKAKEVFHRSERVGKKLERMPLELAEVLYNSLASLYRELGEDEKEQHYTDLLRALSTAH